MKARSAFAAALAMFAATAYAAAEIRFTPAGQGAGFRKVLVAPAEVQFHREFLAENRAPLGRAERLTEEDTRRLARDMGDAYRKALEEAFQARGFELASAPGPDVLQLRPVLRDLYVNAPQGSTAAITRSYVREAGTATMVVEGRDARGTQVLVASEDGTTNRVDRLHQATRPSNLFWFEGMFRRWAEDVAGAVTRR